MMDMITKENIPNVLSEIEQAYQEIPFGNTEFQNVNFVVNASLTPERAYRAIGLRMFDRIRALKEVEYARMKDNIDIEELEHKISLPETNDFDKRRYRLEIDKKMDDRGYTDKLAKDAIAELNTLYSVFKQLPRFTRVQFEAGERVYFEQHLNDQLRGIVGAAESLRNMGAIEDGVKPLCVDGSIKIPERMIELGR
jgi:hypothetical protein